MTTPGPERESRRWLSVFVQERTDRAGGHTGHTLLDCEKLPGTNLHIAKCPGSCASTSRVKEQTTPIISTMIMFSKVKPEAVLSDLMSPHQKTLVTKTSEKITNLK